MKIYLAGSIPKGDEAAKNFDNWHQRYRAVLEPLFFAECLIPRAGEVDETDYVLVVGKDSYSIKISDLVVVNAESKLGAGTAMELVIARYLKKPVVTVLPKNTHHRRSNLMFDGVLVEDWVHPFIKTFSDFVVEKVDDISAIKDQVLSAPVKDISIIDKAIARREASLK